MPLELLNTDTFGKTPIAPRRWLWDGYLAAGMVTLLTSRWKAGKTTLLSVLLAKFGTGGTVGGADVATADAIVVSEEPPDLWQERAARLGFAPGIRFACRPFRGRPTAGEWVELLAELAARRPGLVVLDPLAMFLPGAVENNASALLDALEPLHRLTAAGTAVLLVHHPRKGGGADELSPRGSGALTGFADILLDLDRPPGGGLADRRRWLKADSRLRGSTARLIELAADGRDYLPLPDPPEREGFEVGWPLLKAVLEDAPRRQTRKALLKAWPEDFDTPSPATLRRWLDRAVRDGLAEVRGSGRHRDPFRYALPGLTFDTDPFDLPLDPHGGPAPPPHLKALLMDMKKMLG